MDALGRLTPAQLREAQARIRVLLPAAGDNPRALNDEQLLHEVLRSALRERKAPSLPPPAVLRKARHYPAYLEGARVLGEFVDDSIRPRTRAERAKVFRILTLMLLRWMTRCRIPVSHRSFAATLPKVAEIVDQQFPGYREAGLLRVLVTARRAETV